MKLEEIRKLLDAQWVGGGSGLNDCGAAPILSCQASDLMSDVLAGSGMGSLLLTGLTNAQVVRVAEVSDFAAICFVRGKRVQPEVIQLAEERQIPLIVTPLSMFESCGLLFAGGLRAAVKKESADCRTGK
jgi:predicted transcriptional regulator